MCSVQYHMLGESNRLRPPPCRSKHALTLRALAILVHSDARSRLPQVHDDNISSSLQVEDESHLPDKILVLTTSAPQQILCN